MKTNACPAHPHKKKVVWVQRVILLAVAGGAILTTQKSYGGTGATHHVAGALVAKYLSMVLPESTSPEPHALRNALSYGSAFLVGMASHLVLDHFGNFEPEGVTPEMAYFVVEGTAGAILLIPHWKRDPRLFWGSVGGVFPDLEHSIRPFGRRLFPTHNGLLPHGERRSFWQGAAENLIFNGVALYVLYKNPLFHHSPSLVSVGLRLSYWDNPGALKRGFSEALRSSYASLYPQLLLRFHAYPHISFEASAGTWMRRQRINSSQDHPGRVLVNPYLLNLLLHASRETRFIPFATVGAGLYVASESRPVVDCGIAFSRYRTKSLGANYGGGLEIRINPSESMILDMRYHNINFLKRIDGSHDFSGWEVGISMVHHL